MNPKNEQEKAWADVADAIRPRSGIPPFFSGTDEMLEIFNAKAQLQRWLDIEAALARAEAEVGLIPKEAADEISKKAKVQYIDPVTLRDKWLTTDHPVVSMIWAFSAACEGGYGQFIHWGATTQDIYDTSFAMALKKAHPILIRDLKEILTACLDLAEKHKNTVMAGRTHSQQAVPLTFGFKAAIWATEFARSIERMTAIEPRLYVGNLTGAAGTFAAMAPKAEEGPRIQELMMNELGLSTFPVCWHSSRDVRAEYASVLAIIATTIGKIANEVFTLGRTEIKELEEPIPEGTVGSSTMPGKRNPGTCEELITLSFQARRVASLSFDGMMVNNERDMGWPIGDSAPQILIMIVSVMLDWGKWLLKDLTVMPENMRRNINEMLMTEALMIRLAEKAGRQTAHELVEEAVKKCVSAGMSLTEAVLQDKEIMHHMTQAEIEQALDPAHHIGAVPAIVDNVLEKLRPLTK